MDKLKMQTPNLVDKNIEQIANIFPNVQTEIKDEAGNNKKTINFDLLKQSLSNVLEDDECERYRLDWPGKKASLLKANTPINKTLRPCREESVDFDTTENIYIKGDNFEVLKILQESYLGKIKMIYIDPPYNTGNDFIYSDNFEISKEEYEDELGVENEEGEKLFKNTDSNGRFHSDWLSMMFERLVVARDLLKENGVVFISIDDGEVHNLRKICDEIFGEESFLNQISVKAKPSSGASGGGEDKRLKKNVEYLLCYTKNRENFEKFNDVWSSKDLFEFIDEYNRSKKSWKYTRILYSLGEKKHFADTVDGSGERIKVFKHENVIIKTIVNLAKEENLSIEKIYSRYFEKIFRDTNAQSSIRQRVIEITDNDDTFYSIEYIPKSGRNKGKLTTLYYKGRNKDLIAWLSDVADKENGSLIKKDKIGTLWDSFNWNNVSKEGNIQYPNGKKPIDFIKRMIEMTSSESKDDFILDFFAGSGSTAHAIFDMNCSDGGKRKCIAIQIPEIITERDKKKYYSHDDFKHISTVFDVLTTRVIRAGKKISDELEENNKQLKLGTEPINIDDFDLGFRVYKTDSTNMKDVYYHPEELQHKQLSFLESNVKEDRTPDDLLTQVILDLGLELSLPIEKKEILGNSIYIVQANALVACFDDSINFKIVDEIAELKPFKVVFKDTCFKDDKDRINVEERFKRLSPETAIMVI
jgi:adenine-specific DNA-methyltransferase